MVDFIQLNGHVIVLSAVESFKYDERKSEIVVRTVSGIEHRKEVTDRKEFVSLVTRTLGPVYGL